MKKLPLVVAGLAVAILWPAVSSRSQESKHEAEMQRKLELAKGILDGLVTDDFQKIERSATSLNELGKRKWQENATATYRAQNQVFWFATGTLLMAAEKRNIDGATLAYTQMTQSCVNCHKQLR